MNTSGAEPATSRQTASLCVSPSTDDRSFHLRPDPSTGNKFHAEIIDALSAPGRGQQAVAGLMGDVLGRMKAARKGELADGAEVVPVQTQPVLWEVRWQFGKDGEYRLYHAEPGGKPDFVALRFHRKDTSSEDPKTIEDLQNAEMAIAASRYVDGAGARWGHGRRCSNCLNS